MVVSSLGFGKAQRSRVSIPHLTRFCTGRLPPIVWRSELTSQTGLQIIIRDVSPPVKNKPLGGFAQEKIIMSSVVIVSEAEALREEVAIYRAALQKIVRITNEWQANRLGGVNIQRKRWERCAEIARQAIESAQPLRAVDGGDVGESESDVE